MRRDMSFVRGILLAAEELPAKGGRIEPLPGRSDDELRYHLRIMSQAGLLDVRSGHEGAAYETIWVNGLTWRGHDFLDAARHESV